MASSVELSDIFYTRSSEAIQIQADVAKDGVSLGLYLDCSLTSRFLGDYYLFPKV